MKIIVILETEMKKEKWYTIPGFKLYEITKKGVVRNLSTGGILTGGICGPGYWNFHLIKDDGIPIVIGLHRLIAMTVIPCDDAEKTIVNHIDGDKLNNTIENLEWVTFVQNVLHAGMEGSTSKCLPMSARNVLTGEVFHFSSILECSNHVGVKHDSMKYRYRKYNGYVYPEKWQYHRGIYTGTWRDPVCIEQEIRETKALINAGLQVQVKNIFTGEITIYSGITKLSSELNIRHGHIRNKLWRMDEPVFPPGLQIRYIDSRDTPERPWRELKSLKAEYKDSMGIIEIVAENAKTGEKQTFHDEKSVIEHFGFTKTALKNRLRLGKRFPTKGFYFYFSL